MHENAGRQKEEGKNICRVELVVPQLDLDIHFEVHVRQYYIVTATTL